MNRFHTRSRNSCRLLAVTVLAAAGLSLLPLTPSLAGSAFSTIDHTDVVLANDVDSYSHTFAAGEPAIVAARGTGDIDLQVLDENGHVVAEDLDPDNTPVVRFVPRWTGRFTIRVSNSEGYPVRYHLVSN